MNDARWFLIGATVAATAVGLPALALVATFSNIENPFNIVLDFNSEVDFDTDGISDSEALSPDVQTVFHEAGLFWETSILGNRYDLSITPLSITAGASEYACTSSGLMCFDTVDLGSMHSDGTLFDVIVHEMAHVMGFGMLWSPGSISTAFSETQNVYSTGGGEYTGAFGVAAYTAEFGLSESHIPVELDGGTGTANSHWDEDAYAGGSSDIMTGYIGTPFSTPNSVQGFDLAATTVPGTTIASFADLGYFIYVDDIVAAAVPLPTGFGLLLVGLGGWGALRIRRRARA